MRNEIFEYYKCIGCNTPIFGTSQNVRKFLHLAEKELTLKMY